MCNGEVIALAIELSGVRSLGRTVDGSVVSASEDAIDAVLVQNVCIEEDAETRFGTRGRMTCVVGRLLLAGGCAN